MRFSRHKHSRQKQLRLEDIQLRKNNLPKFNIQSIKQLDINNLSPSMFNFNNCDYNKFAYSVLPSTSFLPISEPNYLLLDQMFNCCSKKFQKTQLIPVQYPSIELHSQPSSCFDEKQQKVKQKTLRTTLDCCQKLIQKNQNKKRTDGIRIAFNNYKNKASKRKNHLTKIKHQIISSLMFKDCDKCNRENDNRNCETISQLSKLNTNHKSTLKFRKCAMFSPVLFSVKNFTLLFFTLLTIFIGTVFANWNDNTSPNTTYISQVII